jgi:2'-5' RNA ligase
LTIIEARFTLASMPRRTALVVAVPEAEPAVAALRFQHDPSARLGAPAHITIHFPFAPPEAVDENAVASLLARRAAFTFELASVEYFGDDVTYLAPRPAAPFHELIEASAARWPEYPLYDGAHEEIVPHLTVGLTRLEPRLDLPIACVARAVTLLEEGDDDLWSERRRFELQAVVA